MHALNPWEFSERWNEWHGEMLPHGWALRESHPTRWMRVHSLPGSKRYPGTAREYAIILARDNSIVDAMIGRDECVLVGYEYGGAHQLASGHALRGWLPDAPPVMRLAAEDDESEPTFLFAGRGAWYRGMLDLPLRAVADDELRFMILNWDTGAVFAPYDGGADVLWPSESERNDACDKFREWLSPHASGL
ncbi:hypothetical protein BH09GEM1_BH09GEM1_30180 [soil metagenome]